MIAWLLSWIRSRTQIADITVVPESTVSSHVIHLRDKLGVADWRDIGAMARHLVNVLRAGDAHRAPGAQQRPEAR